MSNGKVNLVFGVVVGLLACMAGVSMYLNRNLPVIREAPETSLPSGSKLPENHPPIDAANRVDALEQASRNEPGNAAIRVQLGNAHYDMGQFQEAAEAYEECLRLNPGNPEVETDLATCYFELKQNDKALAILDKVLQYQPKFGQALYNKGIVLSAGKNDLKGAIAAWEALLQTNPDYPRRAELEQKINSWKAAVR